MDLRESDWIGFDLDHTAVRYNVPELAHLVHDAMARFVVEYRGYTKDVFCVSSMPHFFARGLYFDCETGCFLRLSSEGAVLSASHGTNPLSQDEIKDMFCSTPKQKKKLSNVINSLVRGEKVKNGFFFVTFFDIPAASILASMVDDVDIRVKAYRKEHPSVEGNDGDYDISEKETKHETQAKDNMWEKREMCIETMALLVENSGYDFVLKDMFDGLGFNFEHTQFAANQGYYFPQLKINPHKFIFEAHPRVIQWLQAMPKEHNVKLFLLTNSHQDYATFLLEHTFGKRWKELFDVVIFYAAKPQFFHHTKQSCPFVLANDDFSSGDVVDDLELGGMYIGGNYEQFQAFLNTHKSKNNKHEGEDKLRVVYFGDHPLGDVVSVALHSNWVPIFVMEELAYTGDEALHMFESDKDNQCAVREADTSLAKFIVLGIRRWGGHFLTSLNHVGKTTSSSPQLSHEDDIERYSAPNILETILRTYASCIVPHLAAVAANDAHIFASFENDECIKGIHRSFNLNSIDGVL
eukprot:m.74531 g.74531  ORF g.74531 m.74531 type:complete len:522 (-) comp8454_c0_seq1:2824-4389(-)